VHTPLKVEYDVDRNGQKHGLGDLLFHKRVILVNEAIYWLLESMINSHQFRLQLLFWLCHFRMISSLPRFHDHGLELALKLLFQFLTFLLELVKVTLKRKQAFLEVTWEYTLDGSLFGNKLAHLIAALNNVFEESLLFLFPFLHDALENGSEVIVLDDVLLVEWPTAFRALMVSIDAFFDAVLAERMPALGDVRILVCVAANHALRKSLDDLINTDLKRVVVPALSLPENWLLVFNRIVVSNVLWIHSRNKLRDVLLYHSL
jgi:hypothetical protein